MKLIISSALILSALADDHHPAPHNNFAPRNSLLYRASDSNQCVPNEKTCEQIPIAPGNSDEPQIPFWPDEEETNEYWMTKADEEFEARQKVLDRQSTKKAKYSIIFLGDGMGVNSITAGRIYTGQSEKLPNSESFKTAMDEVADVGSVGLSKTYCVDRQTTDSAASGTAYLTGVKTKYHMLGLNAQADYQNCLTTKDEHVTESVLKKAKKAGLATGIVTTTGKTFLNLTIRGSYELLL